MVRMVVNGEGDSDEDGVRVHVRVCAPLHVCGGDAVKHVRR